VEIFVALMARSTEGSWSAPVDAANVEERLYHFVMLSLNGNSHDLIDILSLLVKVDEPGSG